MDFIINFVWIFSKMVNAGNNGNDADSRAWGKVYQLHLDNDDMVWRNNQAIRFYTLYRYGGSQTPEDYLSYLREAHDNKQNKVLSAIEQAAGITTK